MLQTRVVAQLGASRYQLSAACHTRPIFRRSYASATAATAKSPPKLPRLLVSAAIGVTVGLGYFYVTDTRSSIHQWLISPLMQAIYPDAEDSHLAAIGHLKSLWRFNLHPRERRRPDAAGDLQIEVFGQTLQNPLGISAGMDKQAEIPDALFSLGPAIVELGGITPHPQTGNQRPRCFRVPSMNGIINRFGLNSEGNEFISSRLRQRVREFAYGYGIGEDSERFVLNGGANVPPGSLSKGKLLAIQVGKQETTPDGDIEAIKRDYVFGTTMLARYADIIVVNVSCPNAPGYRELQQAEPLTRILGGVVEAAKSIDRKQKPAVMVKVSPDEDTEEQITSICDAIWQSGVDGVIVGNTTKRRPAPSDGRVLSRKEAEIMRTEAGGYSGPQLFEQTLSLVGKYRRILDRGPQFEVAKKQTPSLQEETSDRIEASIEHDLQNLKSPAEDASDQPLIRLPERHSSSTEAASGSGNASALSISHHMEQASSEAPWTEPKQKVIFCTGGITNGKQALEVLAAGASVCQIYTGRLLGGSR